MAMFRESSSKKTGKVCPKKKYQLLMSQTASTRHHGSQMIWLSCSNAILGLVGQMIQAIQLSGNELKIFQMKKFGVCVYDVVKDWLIFAEKESGISWNKRAPCPLS